MSRSIRDWPIARKLNLLLLLAVTVLFSAMTFFLIRHVSQAMTIDSLDNLTRISKMTIDMTDAYKRSLESNVNRLGGVFVAEFPDGFTLDASSAVPIGELKTPVLNSGKTALNLNSSAVDRFSQMTGGVATVFVRKDDEFIRLARSVYFENDTRARIKKDINLALGSAYVEEKSYEDYGSRNKPV